MRYTTLIALALFIGCTNDVEGPATMPISCDGEGEYPCDDPDAFVACPVVDLVYVLADEPDVCFLGGNAGQCAADGSVVCQDLLEPLPACTPLERLSLPDDECDRLIARCAVEAAALGADRWLCTYPRE